jgi:valyl-tRNA synthetase
MDAGVEAKVNFLIEVVRAIRNLRSELNCPPGREVRVVFLGSEDGIALLREQEPYLRALARLSSVEYGGDEPKGAVTAVVGSTRLFLPLEGALQLTEEAARLTKEVGKVELELERIRKKLSSGDFIAKAKAEVVQKEKDKSQELQEKIGVLKRSLERIRELEASLKP